MQENENSGEKPMSEDEIDETLDDSFPASDPPSCNLGTDHRKEKPKANDDAENTEQMKREDDVGS